MEYSLDTLNKLLFGQLEKLADDKLDGDRLDEELKRADQMVKVSGQIISSGQLQLSAQKHADEYGYSMAKHMPEMLEVRRNVKKNAK
jgi:hypothetical protein